MEDKIARFEFQTHYADKDEALEAIEPFIRHWEFEAAMQVGPGSFRLRYKEAEIVDQQPSPPEPTSGPQEVRAEVYIRGNLSVSAPVTRGLPHYPPPPAGGAVDPDDDTVVKMTRRYDQYCLGRATLPDVAYFCMDLLEEKYGGLTVAARECGISKNVLVKTRSLSSTRGGEVARKAVGADKEFTSQEKQFLNQAIPKIIFRVAQVAADDSQCLPQITMADLPSL